MTEIRVQHLEENNFNHGKLFKLSQGWHLRLQLSNSIVHKNVRVFCNLPPLSTTNATTKFERIKYYELEWQRDHTTDAIRHGDFNK